VKNVKFISTMLKLLMAVAFNHQKGIKSMNGHFICNFSGELGTTGVAKLSLIQDLFFNKTLRHKGAIQT